MSFERTEIDSIRDAFQKPVRLDIADCAWWELERVCKAAGFDAQVTAEGALRVWTDAMQQETYRKAVLGDSWSQDQFSLHSSAYESDFVLSRSPRISLPPEIVQPFSEFAEALGYDPHQLASHGLVQLARKIAQNHLKARPSFSM